MLEESDGEEGTESNFNDNDNVADPNFIPNDIAMSPIEVTRSPENRIRMDENVHAFSIKFYDVLKTS